MLGQAPYLFEFWQRKLFAASRQYETVPGDNILIRQHRKLKLRNCTRNSRPTRKWIAATLQRIQQQWIVLRCTLPHRGDCRFPRDALSAEFLEIDGCMQHLRSGRDQTSLLASEVVVKLVKRLILPGYHLRDGLETRNIFQKL